MGKKSQPKEAPELCVLARIRLLFMHPIILQRKKENSRGLFFRNEGMAKKQSVEENREQVHGQIIFLARDERPMPAGHCLGLKKPF